MDTYTHNSSQLHSMRNDFPQNMLVIAIETKGGKFLCCTLCLKTTVKRNVSGPSLSVTRPSDVAAADAEGITAGSTTGTACSCTRRHTRCISIHTHYKRKRQMGYPTMVDSDDHIQPSWHGMTHVTVQQHTHTHTTLTTATTSA